jgi:peptidoglycan/xylan/chitin deacetylase (PgdA/CDA1 family)
MRLPRLARTCLELCLISAIIFVALNPFYLDYLGIGSTIVKSVPTNKKVVALTFDDGPCPPFTPQILDTLKAQHIKATFFMIGERVEKYPELAKRTANEGHAIENHTFTHPGNISSESKAQVAGELDRCSQAIEKLAGRKPDLFRPPKGEMSNAIYRASIEKGYRIVLWSVSADHREARTPQAMADRVLRLVQPGGIILIHDGFYPSRWRDAAALPLIIDGLKERGYTFVTVPELLKTRPTRWDVTNPPIPGVGKGFPQSPEPVEGCPSVRIHRPYSNH